MSPLSRDEIDRIVIRGLSLNSPQATPARMIAAHYKLDESEVESSLLRLRRKRLARDRQRGGERVWEPWR